MSDFLNLKLPPELNQKPVESALPHSGEMILVDGTLAVSESEITTLAVIREGSPCVVSGRFGAYQLIEIMAQSLGLYKSFWDADGGAMGFLVGARRFSVRRAWLAVGDEVVTRAVLSIQDEGGFGVYDCECSVAGEVVASARVSVLSPSRERFLELTGGG